MRADISEYEKVENLGKQFCEGVKTGNVEILKKIFHDEASMYGMLSEKETQFGPIKNLYDVVEKTGKCEKYAARVDVLCVDRTSAIVRVIEDGWNDYKFTDYLNCLKINGEWKVVAKVYDVLEAPKK